MKRSSKQLMIDQYCIINHTCNDQELTTICTHVFHELKCKNTENIQAEFYPYSNIKLTINKRNNIVLIRMADTLANAPKKVLISAANIIISRFLNKKCKESYRMYYREYIYSDEIRVKVKSVRRMRSKKRIANPKGKFFDLDECFNKINSKYFNGDLLKPTLSWSTRRGRTNMGQYDMDLDALVISKRFDSKKTPKYVVEFIIYHELLHQRYPGKFINGCWVVHTPEFKNSEKLFEEYKEASEWLKHF